MATQVRVTNRELAEVVQEGKFRAWLEKQAPGTLYKQNISFECALFHYLQACFPEYERVRAWLDSCEVAPEEDVKNGTTAFCELPEALKKVSGMKGWQSREDILRVLNGDGVLNGDARPRV